MPSKEFTPEQEARIQELIDAALDYALTPLPPVGRKKYRVLLSPDSEQYRITALDTNNFLVEDGVLWWLPGGSDGQAQ